jgi:hypothetical protein
MEIYLSSKVAEKNYCSLCHYRCSKNSDFAKHLITRKHEKHINGNNLEIKEIEKVSALFVCVKCDRRYRTNSGLWKHKQQCKYIEQNIVLENPETPLSNNVIIELVKQNQEFKELIIEQNKQIIELTTKVINTNTNITNNNCHNKTKFNLNLFLNEQCKDALNIMDFVNNLQLQLTDLENVGKLGYSEGISKIFINGLKQLDVFKRPIHCNDLKREVLYVKDKDSWEKENDGNKKITNAINHISNKNIKQISKWAEDNPSYKNSTSIKNDEYLNIVSESMGAIDPSNIEKVIHNIAKEVFIEK